MISIRKKESGKTSGSIPRSNSPMDDTLCLCATKTLARRRETDILNGSGILFGHRCFSLQEFLKEIFRQYYPEAKILSEEGQRILLAGIMERFSPYDFRSGDYLSRFISEIKLSLIPHEKIFQAKKNAPLDIQERLEQLEVFFTAYSRELEKHDFKDKSDIGLLALDVMNDLSRNIGLLAGKSKVVVEGLTEDHRLWYALIAGLSRRMPVVVKLPFAACDSHDVPVAAIISNLELTSRQSSRLTVLYSDPISIGSIEHERKRTVVTYADQRYREVEGIGRRIRELLGRGVDPQEIAVGFRDLSGYGPILTDIFDRYQIPLAFRRGNPIRLNPAVKAAVLPLTVIKNGFEGLDLLRLFRSDYFSLGYGEQLKRLFEAAGAVKGDKRYYRRKISALLETGSTEENRSSRDCSQKLDFCMELLEGMTEGRSLEDFVADYRCLLRKFDFFSPGYIAEGLREQPDKLLKRDLSCIKALETVLDELEGSKTFFGDKKISFERFYELLVLLLNNVTALTETDSEVAGVRALNLLDLAGMKFEYLFIGGFKEGEYPGTVSENPLFPDRLKAYLRKRLKTSSMGEGKPFIFVGERREQEYLGFCLSISAARDSLFLSYWGEDRDDDRSVFLKEFLDSFRGRVETRVVPRTLARLDYASVYQDFELEVKLAHDYKHLFSDHLAKAIFSGLKKKPEFSKIIQVVFPNLKRCREQMDFQSGPDYLTGACPGKLESPGLRQGIVDRFSDGGRFLASPTSLEIYADCPQKFFLKKIIEVPGFFSLDWEADPLIEGRLIHDLMEKCVELTALFIRKGAKDRPYLEEQWKKIISKELSHDLPGTGDQRLQGVRDRLTAERVLNNLKIDLERLLENQLIPVWFERDFKINTKINLDFGKELLLNGRIDRLDVGKGKLAVIDYKYSNSTQLYKEKISRKKLGSRTLQLPVYLLAALHENPPKNYLEAGFELVKAGELVSISTDPAKKNYWSLEELETLVGFKNGKMVLEEENLLGRIKKLTEGIATGDFLPRPSDSDTCEFCDYRFICQFSEN